MPKKKPKILLTDTGGNPVRKPGLASIKRILNDPITIGDRGNEGKYALVWSESAGAGLMRLNGDYYFSTIYGAEIVVPQKESAELLEMFWKYVQSPPPLPPEDDSNDT
jgi:hypothetical protein